MNRAARRSRTTALALVAAAAGLGWGPALCRAAADGRPRPLGYTLDARWAPSQRLLSGTETIQLRNDGPGTLPLVWLRLWPNDSIPGEAEGCDYPNLKIVAVRGAAVARYAVACSAVALRLPAAIEPGGDATISVAFTVRVPTANTLFGRSAGIDLLGRAVPVMAVRDGAGWHLDRDSATGDPAYSLSAAWHATLRVPTGLTVASTGVELSNRPTPDGRERVIAIAAAQARDFGFAVGRLSERSATVDGVTVHVLRSSRTSARAAAGALRDAVEAVRAYTAWYGPYTPGDYDVVLSRLGLDSQELPGIAFTNPGLGYIAHETAHMWFYDMVGDDQHREPWLDESFASWSEEQLVPGSYACDPRRPLRSQRGGLARGLAYYESRPGLYSDVIYRGGSCALTALAGALGRARFLAMLREEVTRYRDGIVHTADFVALLRQVDPAIATRWTNLVGLQTG